MTLCNWLRKNCATEQVDRLNDIGRRYGMEIKMGKNKAMRISRQPSLVQIMIETTGEYEIFQLFGQHDNK